MTNEVLTIAESWPFVSLPTLLLADRDVPRPAKLTWCALVLWGRGHGRVWASKDKLAQAAGVNRSTLYRHLASLEHQGWITQGHDGRRPVIQVHRRKVHRRKAAQVSHQRDTGVSPVRINMSHQRDIEVEREKEKKEGECVSPPKTLRDQARALAKVYPHGWSEGGAKRAPGIKQSTVALGVALRGGATYEHILAGAGAFAQATASDAQFNPAMHRWIAREGWLEVPERVEQRQQMVGNPPESDRERATRKRAEAQAEAEGADPAFLEAASRLSRRLSRPHARGVSRGQTGP